MSACEYISESEQIKNIKRLLKGSGYLHDVVIPKHKYYDELLFQIEYDIKTFLNSNNINLRGIWIEKYMQKLAYFNCIDSHIDNYIEEEILQEEKQKTQPLNIHMPFRHEKSNQEIVHSLSFNNLDSISPHFNSLQL